MVHDHQNQPSTASQNRTDIRQTDIWQPKILRSCINWRKTFAPWTVGPFGKTFVKSNRQIRFLLKKNNLISKWSRRWHNRAANGSRSGAGVYLGNRFSHNTCLGETQIFRAVHGKVWDVNSPDFGTMLLLRLLAERTVQRRRSVGYHKSICVQNPFTQMFCNAFKVNKVPACRSCERKKHDSSCCWLSLSQRLYLFSASKSVERLFSSRCKRTLALYKQKPIDNSTIAYVGV